MGASPPPTVPVSQPMNDCVVAPRTLPETQPHRFNLLSTASQDQATISFAERDGASSCTPPNPLSWGPEPCSGLNLNAALLTCVHLLLLTSFYLSISDRSEVTIER